MQDFEKIESRNIDQSTADVYYHTAADNGKRIDKGWKIGKLNKRFSDDKIIDTWMNMDEVNAESHRSKEGNSLFHGRFEFHICKNHQQGNSGKQYGGGRVLI